MNQTNRNQYVQRISQLIDEIGATTSLSQLLETHYQNPSKHFQATTAGLHQLRAQEQEPTCHVVLSVRQDISLEQPKRNQVLLEPLILVCTEKTFRLHYQVNHQIQNSSPELLKWLKKRNKINRKIAKALAKQTGLKVKV